MTEISKVLSVQPGYPPVKDIRVREWLSRLVVQTNASLSNALNSLNHQVEFVGVSDVQQDPVGTDNPMKVSWGTGGSSESVIVHPNGDIEILLDDIYLIEAFFQVGRVNNPQYSLSTLHTEVNGVPGFTSWAVTLNGSPDYTPLYASVAFPLTKGDIANVYMTRDSAGANDGSLIPFIPTNPAIPTTASTRLMVRRIGID